MPTSWLMKKLHNVPRRDAYYKPLTNSFNIKDSDYVDGVVLVSVYHYYWLAAALLIIPLAFLRAYRINPKGNINEALYKCMVVIAIGLVACSCLEVLQLQAVTGTMRLGVGEGDQLARELVKEVREKTIAIKRNLTAPLAIQPEDGRAARAVHEVLTELVLGSDQLADTIRDHSHAAPVETPMAKEIWNIQWFYFISLMTYWCLGLAIVGATALFKCPYVGAALGVTWCCSGAALATAAALACADACCEPHRVTEQMVERSMESSSMSAEYRRVCREWRAGALLAYSRYQELFHRAENRLNGGTGLDNSLYRAAVSRRIRDLCLNELVELRRSFMNDKCEESEELVQKDLGNEAMRQTCEENLATQLKMYQIIAMMVVGAYVIGFLTYVTCKLRAEGKCPCWKPPRELPMPAACPGPPPNLRHRKPKQRVVVSIADDLDKYIKQADAEAAREGNDHVTHVSGIQQLIQKSPCSGTVACPGAPPCAGPGTCPGAGVCPGPRLGEAYCICRKMKEHPQLVYVKHLESAPVLPLVLKVDSQGRVQAVPSMLAPPPPPPPGCCKRAGLKVRDKVRTCCTKVKEARAARAAKAAKEKEIKENAQGWHSGTDQGHDRRAPGHSRRPSGRRSSVSGRRSSGSIRRPSGSILRPPR